MAACSMPSGLTLVKFHGDEHMQGHVVAAVLLRLAAATTKATDEND